MSERSSQGFPERHLMSVLSDLLGIPHFTTSRGSTVRKDFLLAVADALGLDRASLAGASKDDVLRACIETATREAMEPDLLSPGGTVTNQALQRIVNGIVEHGAAGRPALPPAADPGPSPTTDLGLSSDAEAASDALDRRLFQQAAQSARDPFRTRVVEAYDHRCAITGSDAVDGLQAARIYPYQGPAADAVSNGICLRADLATLFERGQLSFHESTYKVLLKAHLHVTEYSAIEGERISLPSDPGDHPSTAALRAHREWTGL